MKLQTEAAENYYYSGEYKKKIGKKTYYISMNEYSDFEGKYVGCFYVFNSKKNLKKFKVSKYGEFYKIGKNRYRYKTKKGTLTFKISKKSMSVKQTGTVIKGVKLKGIFKKTKRYPAP